MLTSLANLGLAPLGNYGGPTQTMALLARQRRHRHRRRGQLPGHGNPITTDQRGEPLDSPDPDIGAFQSQGFTLTAVAGSTPQSTSPDSAFANPLAVTVTANNAVEPVAGGIVTFTAPSSGASAILSGTTATIGSNGVASVTATANATAGSYTVTASTGTATPVHFPEQPGPARHFTGLTNQTITYGSTVTFAGTLAAGSQAPVGETSP